MKGYFYVTTKLPLSQDNFELDQIADREASKSSKKKEPQERGLLNDEIISHLFTYGFDFKHNKFTGNLEILFRNSQLEPWQLLPYNDMTFSKIMSVGHFLANKRNIHRDICSEPRIRSAIQHHAFEQAYDPIETALKEWAAKAPECEQYFKTVCQYIHISIGAKYLEEKHPRFIEEAFKTWCFGVLAKYFYGEQNTTIVLQGKQGIGKSNFFRNMFLPFGEQFIKTSFPDLFSKDALISQRQCLLWAIDECEELFQMPHGRIKSFLTTDLIKEREAYAREFTSGRSKCSFAFTSNEQQFFNDYSGGRRFLYINNLKSFDLKTINRIDWPQFWAGCYQSLIMTRFEKPWKLDEINQTIANEQYEDNLVIDNSWIKNTLEDQLNFTGLSDDFIPSKRILEILKFNNNAKDRNNSLKSISKFMRDNGAWEDRVGHKNIRSWRGVRLVK